MIKLPNIEKSANLILELEDRCINAYLVYSDYEIGRHYVLKDRLVHSQNALISSKYIQEYVMSLQSLWDWQFFRNNTDELMIFAGEGFGIDSVECLVDTRVYDKREILETIRNVSRDINIVQLDNGYIQDSLMGIANKMGYEDVLLVDLDIYSTYLFRLSRANKGKKLSQPVSTGYKLDQGKIEWGTEWRLVDSLNNSKLNAFLTLESTRSKLQNTWANFIFNGGFSNSSVIKDLLRSYTSLQLLTIRNDNDGMFENIGRNKYTTLIIVTGRSVENMSYAELLYALIDGLELNEVCDIAIDTTNSFYPLSRIYANGIAKSGFLVEFMDFISRMDQIVIPDLARGNNKKRVVFNGDIQDENGERRNVYALSNEFTQIMYNPHLSREYVEGSFVNGSSIYSEFNYSLLSTSKRKYKSIIFDTRYRPIVYGPEAKDNKAKISSWSNVSII